MLRLLFPLLPLSPGSVHPEESEEESEPRPKKKKTTSAAAEYVREHRYECLNATKIKLDKDGRVTMTFDFRKPSGVHEDIFSPNISTKIRNRFRLGDRGVALLD